MKTYLDCIPCFIEQALRAVRLVTDDEYIHYKVILTVLNMLHNLSLREPPPIFGKKVYNIVSEITGNIDPFYEIKIEANKKAIEFYPEIKKIVEKSENPLFTACMLSLSGNSIDLATPIKYPEISSLLYDALNIHLVINHYEKLEEKIKNAHSILYFGDNAGEIVFDKIFLEEIIKINKCEIYYAVRDKPIINDVTMDDAIFVGLNNVANVISTGCDAPAVILSQCSKELLNLYRSADIIISKGQGNYEALSEEKGNMFFLLKVKCKPVANDLKVNIGDSVIKYANLE